MYGVTYPPGTRVPAEEVARLERHRIAVREYSRAIVAQQQLEANSPLFRLWAALWRRVPLNDSGRVPPMTPTTLAMVIGPISVVGVVVLLGIGLVAWLVRR